MGAELTECLAFEKMGWLGNSKPHIHTHRIFRSISRTLNTCNSAKKVGGLYNTGQLDHEKQARCLYFTPNNLGAAAHTPDNTVPVHTYTDTVNFANNDCGHNHNSRITTEFPCLKVCRAKSHLTVIHIMRLRV